MSQQITVESLKVILGREVDEIHLTIAKSTVLGLDPETVANMLGVEKAELHELMETQDYKDVRLLIGAEQAKERVDRDFGWDGIEGTALKKLGRRVELENDTETLLKIAAVANRATRRTAPPKENLLDPSQAGARVPLTLTRRFTEKLNQSGQAVERTVTQQISVLDGSAVNPTFKEVNQLLRGIGPAEGTMEAPESDKPSTTRNAKLVSQTQRAAEDEEFSLESMRKLAREISNKR